MEKQEAAKRLTEVMTKFTGYVGKHLPTDVQAKLKELSAREDKPLAKVVYQSMHDNQEAAARLNRPSCAKVRTCENPACRNNSATRSGSYSVKPCEVSWP